MQAIAVGFWWLVALLVAVYLIVKARPESSPQRYRTYVYIRNVEALTADDVLRTYPYEVTVLLPSTAADSTETVYHEVTLNPEDLNPARAREMMRLHTPVTAWVSMYDAHDIVFTNQRTWDAKLLSYAAFVLIAQFLATVASLVNLRMVLHSDPWLVFMFPLTVGLLTFLGLIAARKFVLELTVWVRLGTKPMTVTGRIGGVRQLSSYPGGYEIALMWAPLDMPPQYSFVHVSASKRRTRILLHKLLEAQLEEESHGILRVKEPTPPRTAVSQLMTPQGMSTVKITALPTDDPRFDPRPARVRAAAEKAHRKHEAQIREAQRAFERSTAKARIEEANRAQLGDEDNSIEELAKQGPLAWYYPVNPSRVNLVGVGNDAGHRPHLIWVSLGWLAVCAAAVAGTIYAGFVQPEVLFPSHEIVPGNDNPLGQWS